MRIAAAQAPRRWAQAGKGLISVVFTELARFLLRRSWPMHWCSRC